MRLQDIFLTPIYLLFIYGFLMIIRSKVTDRETRRFFLPAFTLKVFGALGVGLIYYYYYGSGDTTLFYDDTYWVYNPIAQEGSLS